MAGLASGLRDPRFLIHRQWYLEQSRHGLQAFPIRYTNEYFLNGDGSFWVYLKDLYELYKEDALDVAIVRA